MNWSVNCLKNEKIKEQNTGKMLDYEKYLKTLWSEAFGKLIKKKTQPSKKRFKFSQ